jgi:hypothetical protein
MRSLRLVLSVAVIFALGIGYFASQSFALGRRGPEWMQIIDTPVVVWLSLAVLAGAIVLALIRDREEQT